MIGETILHYKILEKLGEGGMGIVYKAYDTKLNRTVALKFLPHYLSSDPNEKERFYHEARAAASINHQNVAVIYEIGEHDSNIFLAMEYVEGKTLKDLIKQESESLTIKRILEVAIQICEGLTVAHEKGIIHRDIKSDNIMLTPKGQIKIMDFGLAKIKGASKLTQAGSTVGTAAYMSPEQAQGEEVDARSDIFSFGIVLYEMLTTHLPFSGEHQAALLYSVVNEEPQPMARFNEKVTQDLERIVIKALAKDRDERYQHIDDMLADLRRERKNLEYVRGGNVKTGTAPTGISESDKEIRSLQMKTEKGKYPLKIIIPAAIIILIAAAVFIFYPFKSNENQNSRGTSAGSSLAVMYFQNITDPADKKHTGDMLANLLITSLSQVKGFDVISRERLLEIEKDLGQTDVKELSPSLAIKIAKRAGVRTMLTGSILQTQPKLAVTTNLINVESGRVIGSQQLTNFSESKIFDLVDSLSILIQNNLKVAPLSTEGIKSIADVTTKSPEAYRAYVTGLDLADKLYWKEANSAFARAVYLDPNFAMAYYHLSNTQNLLGETDDAQKSMQKAVELSDKTTERERLQILAANYGNQNNLQKVIEINDQLIKLYPHEIDPYIYVGFAVDDHLLLDAQKGTELLRNGLKVNPNAKNLWNVLAYSNAYLGKKQEAFDAVNQYIKLAPAEPNPYDSQGDIYAWFMNYDSSRAAYEYATSLRSDFDAYKLGYYELLRQKYSDARKYFLMSGFSIGISAAGGITSKVAFPLIKITRGQIHSAQNKLTEILNSKLSSAERRFVLMEMVHLCYELGQYPEMLKYARELSAWLHKDPSNDIYGRDYVVWALVKNGKSSEAKNLLNEIQGNAKEIYPSLQFIITYTAALVEYEEGNINVALLKFRKATQMLPPNHEPNIFYSKCLLKNGETSESVNELQRLRYWSGNNDIYLTGAIPGEVTYWPIQAVKAHYWLGVAYENQGKTEKALSEYKKFLDIWKNADFNSQEINDAKVRVAKLENTGKR